MNNSNIVITIPTTYSKEKTEAILSQYNSWFYEFEFSNRAKTMLGDPLIKDIHKTRAGLIFPFVDEIFNKRWEKIRCLDIACNQGWFTTQIALRGSKEVVGFDIRDEHLEVANAIKEIGKLDNIKYKKQNLFDIRDEDYEQFDLTLFLGLLYHLDNPMGALKKVRALTKKLCVIETQVARAVPQMECINGSDLTPKHGAGIVVVNSDENHAGQGVDVVLIPTLNALYQMLYAVGFDRIYLAVPPGNTYEQYPNFDRVIVYAQIL